ncbi:PREDICTED: evolutionarily conserved signaling intermediate in Toll pathway, mitochondrial [Nicrophorus vespilloides]|uniref:Evolutionarily conserved signaling intermediate in Toll pathway, mitochondrial n=1 Tax=Nicrophorus vespilloides TaxID=110193 RepID=A0ABM1MNW8_NICVS|nr:PREDICTED: evolutionarily conserved signaling intermediate in Toll pathway, mitochondrial [Nicrophorus vespilloides]
MFHRRYLCQVLKYCKYKCNASQNEAARIVHTSSRFYCDNKENKVQVQMNFENIEKKTKNSYLDMIDIFIGRDVHRRGHVEFIYSAMKNMQSFNVHQDLTVYKALIDVLPKGKFIPTNMFQAEFMHYPKQQQCAIDLLQQMEDNGVMPDYEMEDILLNIFGKRGYPLRKFWRMMYWMPKFKNLSPWPVPNPPPNDSFELAKLAIARISSIDIQSQMTIYHTSDIADSIEDTWIVSAQSPIQKVLLEEHNPKQPIYVEGSFRVWLRNESVNYFILRTAAKVLDYEIEDTDDVSNIKVPFFNILPEEPKSLSTIPSVHEQEDGVIYALCATGTSSKDSLLSWVRHLEKVNPKLTECPIVFTLKSAEKELATFQGNNDEDETKTKIDEK